jgi:hypothetical protein
MTFEFKTSVLPNGQLIVPSDIAGQIPAGKELHIVLTWEAPVDSSRSYHALGQKLNEASYASAEETVYDSLA